MSKHKDQRDVTGQNTDVEPDLPVETAKDAGPATADVGGAGAEAACAPAGAGPKPEETRNDAGDAAIKELKSQNEKLTAELASMKDQYLRKVADYENFRKRMAREREDAVNFANTSLLLDLIGVVDNFDRAIHAENVDYDQFRSGIDMTEKQMLSMLEGKWGLVRFSSKGEEFNPELHEAIAREERADVSEPTVIDEFMVGYRLHGRVIRTAKVKVGLPKPETDAAKVSGTEAAAVENEQNGKA